MPAGRDKTGLDGRHWQNLNPRTPIAQRRDSTTGVKARSRDNQTYLEATSPQRPKSTTPQDTQTDFRCLTALTTRGEDKNRRTFVTKIAKGIGMKLEEEEAVISKADSAKMVIKEEPVDVGKADTNSAS